jgi:2-polyprenyl-3-methyl-5-hydroxy-6-metoxy-1,4-benzoquinol methylase
MLKSILKNIIKKFIGADKEQKSITDSVCLLLSTLKGNNTRKLLDVGCKDGERTLKYIDTLNLNKSNVTGIDIDEKALNKSKRYFKVKKVDIETEKVPFPKEYFDIIIINQVLEHIKNFHFVMAEIDRVLKKGGSVLIGIPNLAGFHNRLLLLIGKQPLCMGFDSTHIRGFTHSIMIQLLKQRPHFKIVRSQGALIYPFPYLIARILAKWMPSISVHTFYHVRKWLK